MKNKKGPLSASPGTLRFFKITNQPKLRASKTNLIKCCQSKKLRIVALISKSKLNRSRSRSSSIRNKWLTIQLTTRLLEKCFTIYSQLTMHILKVIADVSISQQASIRRRGICIFDKDKRKTLCRHGILTIDASLAFL